MAVSLVLNQWFLLTLDYRHDMRKPSQRYLFLCGGFDVCADKTCQNKPPNDRPTMIPIKKPVRSNSDGLLCSIWGLAKTAARASVPLRRF